MVDLSIIILSYNTAQITKNCLDSVIKSLKNSQVNYEIIVVDNASTDESINELTLRLRSGQANFKLIRNTENTGFSKANNQGIKIAQGKYCLFLNSDTLVDKVNFQELVVYLNQNEKVGVLTVKVLLKDGGLDWASHRGFPTLWRSLCYYSGLEKLNKLFGGYHLLDRDLTKIHEIDSPSGAFFLTRKSLLEKLNGFDESFFMYGEDLDLSFRIKELGYQVIYYPGQSMTHLKYQSGLRHDSRETQKKIRGHFYEAMRIFYQKHYAQKYPFFINALVYQAINFKEKL